VASSDVIDVKELFVAALFAPNSSSCVDGVGENGPDRSVRPSTWVAMAVGCSIVSRGRRHVVVGEDLRTRPQTLTGRIKSKNAFHNRRRGRIRLRPTKPLTGRGLRGVRMRTGVGEAVTVWWATAQEPVAIRS
jgi:hypothetical protein